MKFYIKWEYIVFIFLAILLFVLLFGFIFSVLNPAKTFDAFKIAISFTGLFTTFGGAYLGAKISGENAIKLAKRESMISDLNRTMESNYKILESFNTKGVKRNLDFYSRKNNLENTFDVNDFIINFFNFKEMFRHFKMNNDFESAFPLLSYDFKELETRIKCLGDKLWKCNGAIDRYLSNLIKEYGYNNHTIIGYKSGMAINKIDDEDAIIETMHKGKQVDINLKISEVNKAIDNDELRNINKEFENLKEYWSGFKFKTKDDIRDFIAEYYGSYE